MRNRLLLPTVFALALSACASPAITPTPGAPPADTASPVAPAASPTPVPGTATRPAPSDTPPPTATASAATTPTEATAEQPGARMQADMVFHAGLEMVVLLNGSPTDDRLWGWDGTQWRRLAEGGPGERELGGVAYDAGRDRLVVYGGRTFSGSQCLFDTWEWDGQAWEQFDVASPDVCSHFVMEYAPALGQVVLVGGGDENINLHSGMWTWDGEAWEWLDVDTPEHRFHAMSAFDPEHNQLFLLGGFDINNRLFDEFWAWDTAAWELLSLPRPPALSHARMVFDTSRVELVLFGGTTRSRTPFDLQANTWVLTDGAWRQRDVPGPLRAAARRWPTTRCGSGWCCMAGLMPRNRVWRTRGRGMGKAGRVWRGVSEAEEAARTHQAIDVRRGQSRCRGVQLNAHNDKPRLTLPGQSYDGLLRVTKLYKRRRR